MLDGEFVNVLAKEFRGYKAETVVIDGLTYLVSPDGNGGFRVIDLPRPKAMPAPVVLGTLAGFAAYVKENRDKLDLGTLATIVRSHSRVELVGPLQGEFQQRPVFAAADLHELAGDTGFRFGTYLDPETFVIDVQVRFVPTDTRALMLALVGNLKDESVRQANDDGVTQVVAARAGVVMAREVEVPNPVKLKPFRTFREVEQPESRFVLRVKRGSEGQLPTCALYEADGAAWKLEAVSSIATWLREKLDKTGVVVIA
jgi:hypothetical protein